MGIQYSPMNIECVSVINILHQVFGMNPFKFILMSFVPSDKEVLDSCHII